MMGGQEEQSEKCENKQFETNVDFSRVMQKMMRKIEVQRERERERERLYFTFKEKLEKEKK